VEMGSWDTGSQRINLSDNYFFDIDIPVDMSSVNDSVLSHNIFNGTDIGESEGCWGEDEYAIYLDYVTFSEVSYNQFYAIDCSFRGGINHYNDYEDGEN